MSYRAEYLETIEIIDAHLDQFFEDGEIIVFHEEDTLEGDNHIDVYWIKPNKKYRPYTILMTCGMSRYPMQVPEGQEKDQYKEVVMLLPMDWSFGNSKLRAAEEMWPVNHLKSIASIPHDQNTWMGFGHTIAWSLEEEECFPGTNFSASVLISSITLPDSFTKIAQEKGDIHLLSVIPLYQEELKFKMEHGSSGLIDRFNEFELDEILDLNRGSVCQ